MSNLTQSDLHFLSSTTPSLSTVLTTLRRNNLTIHNRLTSCLADADFVLRVRAAFSPESPAAAAASGITSSRPLVANERCGSWYVRPGDKGESAYFKSTDGHERAWKFSTRRLNLHVVDLIEKHDGYVTIQNRLSSILVCV